MPKELISDPIENEQSSSTRFEVELAADIHAISPVVAWVMRLVGELEYAAGKEFEIEMALRERWRTQLCTGARRTRPKRSSVSFRATETAEF